MHGYCKVYCHFISSYYASIKKRNVILTASVSEEEILRNKRALYKLSILDVYMWPGYVTILFKVKLQVGSLKLAALLKKNLPHARSSRLRSATLVKKRLWHRCFPMNFARTPFFIKHLRWLCFCHVHFLASLQSSCSFVLQWADFQRLWSKPSQHLPTQS